MAKIPAQVSTGLESLDGVISRWLLTMTERRYDDIVHISCFSRNPLLKLDHNHILPFLRILPRDDEINTFACCRDDKLNEHTTVIRYTRSAYHTFHMA